MTSATLIRKSIKSLLAASVMALAVFMGFLIIDNRPLYHDLSRHQIMMAKDGIVPPQQTHIVCQRMPKYRLGLVWDFYLPGQAELTTFLNANPSIKNQLNEWEPRQSAFSESLAGLRVRPKSYAQLDACPPERPYPLDIAICDSDNGSIAVYIGIRGRHR